MTTTTHLDLPVPGLHCAGCAGRVTRALDGLEGIGNLHVNPLTRRASLDLDPLRTGLPRIRQRLEQAGYPPALAESTLSVQGMTCAACAARVTRALQAEPLVDAVSVNLASGRARITHAPDLTAARLADRVSALGYPARAAEAGAAPPPDPEAPALRRAAILAALLTLPVVILEMGGHLVPGFHHWLHGLIPMRLAWILQMVLTAAVLAGPGRRFFRTGLLALRRGAPEMNSLVALGAGTAFLFSVLVTLAPQLVPETSRHVWFEAAAVIVTLILTGRWLEARARGQAGAAIRALVDLAPDRASVLRGGQVLRLPVADLVPGDLIRLAPGERVALDGVVTEGQGHLDEAMLTGEPLPVPKGPGDPVTGGTVNGTAALTYRVTATGADTVLARIVAMVEQAQAARLPVQALVDRVTRIFVPAIIGLAGLSFALWLVFGPDLAHAIVAAVSVLIIACPCAMGLAVPVSIMVGSGRGAQMGLLFRRGEALQRLSRARHVAFDKTGTLTLGRPRLLEVHQAGLGRDDALRLAAAAEARSEHPLASAILEAAGPAPLPEAQDMRALPGQGLTARVEGQAVILGNLAALRSAGIAPDAALVAASDRDAAQGATAVHLGLEGRHVASLSLADPDHPDAAEAIARLTAMGLSVTMLSGDQPATAQAVGRRLGLSHVQAGLSPSDKLQAIRAMGAGSVFVGDGINDAPALAAAETGIAIGTGTDVAIEAADVVLISGDPRGVARAIALSRAVMRNIRQNLFWAFAYNIALIPVAMGALVPFGGPQLSPMLGAGAMALSSVFVVGNALRLRNAA